MWVTIAQAFVYYGILMVSQISLVNCHVPNYVSTPANKVEQYCLQSDQCSHDTIPVCGRMGEEKRSFLDLCDLMEYTCDTNMIFVHIDDEPGCPPPEKEEEE